MSHPLKIEAGARRHPVTGVWWERQLVPQALKMSAQARRVHREHLSALERNLARQRAGLVRRRSGATEIIITHMERARIRVLKDALCDDMWRAFGCLRGVKA